MAVTQLDLHRQGKAGTLTDAEVASGAAIALSKLAEAVVQADGGQAFTADQSMGNNKLTSLANGTGANDAINKSQLDAAVQGWDWKQSVRAATTANGALATAYENGDTVDGVTLATGDRILLKNQTTGSENGIYTVNASGAPTRATDADSSADVTAGLSVFVSEGTTNGNTGWTLTTDDPITLATTALVFAQTTGGGASGTVTTVSVASANGFTGSVANATTTPAITLTTSISGVLKGNGTAISAATAGTDYLAPANVITRETPSGAVNGSNTAYTLANTPIAGTEHVYLNGILQEPGAGNDYTISSGTITYLTAPATGDKLRVSYLK